MATLETLIRQIMDTYPNLFALSWSSSGWEASATHDSIVATATGETAQEACYALTTTLALNSVGAEEA